MSWHGYRILNAKRLKNLRMHQHLAGSLNHGRCRHCGETVSIQSIIQLSICPATIPCLIVHPKSHSSLSTLTNHKPANWDLYRRRKIGIFDAPEEKNERAHMFDFGFSQAQAQRLSDHIVINPYPSVGLTFEIQTRKIHKISPGTINI